MLNVENKVLPLTWFIWMIGVIYVWQIKIIVFAIFGHEYQSILLLSTHHVSATAIK